MSVVADITHPIVILESLTDHIAFDLAKIPDPVQVHRAMKALNFSSLLHRSVLESLADHITLYLAKIPDPVQTHIHTAHIHTAHNHTAHIHRPILGAPIKEGTVPKSLDVGS